MGGSNPHWLKHKKGCYIIAINPSTEAWNTRAPAPQPPLDAGEWLADRRWVVNAKTQQCVVTCPDEATAAQIAHDHRSAAAVPKLKDAINELVKRAEFALTTPGLIKGRDELRKAVDEALNQTGDRK